MIPILVCVCILSVTARANARVYKWTDYTKPFGTRLVGIDEIKPTIVEVALPESVAENNEVVLIFSASLTRGTYGMRVLLSINGRKLPALIPGPNVRVVLGQGVIKPGINKLAFLGDTNYSMIDIYDLRIELREPIAKVAKKSPTNDSEKSIYRWGDYSKPFTTRIKVLSDKHSIVQVDLPASIIDHDKIILNISTSLSTVTFGSRISIGVNDTELLTFSVGPEAKIPLPRGILKAGINTIKFNCSNLYSPHSNPGEIDVYELRFELPPLKPTTAQASPSPSSQPIEVKTPAEPEPPKTQLPPASAEPAIPKREENAQAEKAATALKKEMVVPVSRTDIGQRWAVVIGVSEYEDSRIPGLRYATRDAQAVYDWLVSPTGGRFAPARVLLLLDRKATHESIRDALFTWLKQPIEEDLVFIFFAGHGSPESPDVLRNLYLLPYNTKYNNIAATGFPMWDIETALKRFIKARRVVIISDACHSGGVGQAFDMAVRTGRGLQANPINSGLQYLTDLGEGICVISASRDNELSREGKEWGGGHGVFTHYLLEGLNGAADFDKNRIVTIGELSVYVSQEVRRATFNAQNPIVSGRFDPALSIAK
jgi:hypothetical protein